MVRRIDAARAPSPSNVLRIRNSGIPIVGFTWYSLIDQVDWDTALREPNNRVNPLGLYTLDREPRAVGLAYKKLIAAWRTVLPTQSVCLRVPIAPLDGIPPTPARTGAAAQRDDSRQTELA